MQADVRISHGSQHFSVHTKLGDRFLAIGEISYMGASTFEHLKIERPVYYFNRLNVPEKFRGLGVGKQLLHKLLAIADLFDFVILLEVNSSDPEFGNDELTAFYIRNGFKQVQNQHYLLYEPNSR